MMSLGIVRRVIEVSSLLLRPGSQFARRGLPLQAPLAHSASVRTIKHGEQGGDGREPKDDVKYYYDMRGNPDLNVDAVTKRFMRLRNGLYIHARPGRHKHLYRKPQWLRDQLREHAFTSRAMCFLFDNMQSAYWRRPKYYPDDVYEPYHRRTGVPWDYQKKKFYP